ncbi:C40 family peptidase [uncultured Amnibacterium sp.]|uniref:C40 family peptidase n=1 Tax=uncultured Amnibacterium sp. TaxID=1631851 RepID=UPI0035C9F53C
MRRKTIWGAGLTLTGTIAAVAVAAGSIAGAAPQPVATTSSTAATVADVRLRLTALEAEADAAGRAAAIADEAVLQQDTSANRTAADRSEAALQTLAARQTPELTALLQQLTALGVDPGKADGTTATTTALVGRTRALRAVSYARKQIGDPYGFAQAGPKRFDCSGLTMKAYTAVKVSIGGHSATAQWSRAKARNRLHSYASRKPGDLIFYGSPGAVYHVAIYVGHGRMIEAPYPGKRVREVAVRSGDRLSVVARPA